MREQIQKAIFDKYPQPHDLKRQWDMADDILAIVVDHIKGAENPYSGDNTSKTRLLNHAHEAERTEHFRIIEDFRKKLLEALDDNRI